MKPVVLLIMMLSAVGLDATVTKKAETKEAQDKHTTPTPNKEPQTLSRGWGDDLDWVQTYEEGLAKAKEEQKTLMVIHHLEDCPYSQDLKKAFSSHQEIQKLAKKFIMLNLVYPPTDKNQAPDGYYVPRIIFVGKLNEVSDKVKRVFGADKVKKERRCWAMVWLFIGSQVYTRLTTTEAFISLGMHPKCIPYVFQH
ncbi:anterior gradient protein 2-A-like [Protopterus annectens]|uniref:anterior gradient protein 2-A-like n=1 Tax=Protopterus annectens TaxID=7888 RepID=UPI001CF97B73|nr:anterior gradient protein 2-A-like [Protopterus annectens]